MKFHRVKGTLPVGVVSITNTHTAPARGGDFFERFLDSFDTQEQRVSSNTPLILTLEVPEGSADETAKVLRAMADELARS